MSRHSPFEMELRIPDIRQIEQELGELQEKAPLAMYRSINKTVKHLISKTGKEVKKNYVADKLRAKDIKETFKIKKAGRSDLSGEAVSMSDFGIPLYRFRTSPKDASPAAPPRFYKSKLLKSSSLKKLSGKSDSRSKGFIATMPNKNDGENAGEADNGGNAHTGVFERDLTKDNQPLKELYGVSIPTMLGSQKVANELIRDSEDFFQRTVEHEILFITQIGGE